MKRARTSILVAVLVLIAAAAAWLGPQAADPAGWPVVTRNSVTLAVAADIGSDAQARRTLAAMASTGAQVHLVLGDLSYAGARSEQAWCELVHRELGEDATVQIVAGNHEDDTGQDGRIAEFERCLPDGMSSTGKYGREYYFDIGRLARIILISPDLTINEQHYYYGEGNSHESWLSGAIDEARGRGSGGSLSACTRTA